MIKERGQFTWRKLTTGYCNGRHAFLPIGIEQKLEGAEICS